MTTLQLPARETAPFSSTTRHRLRRLLLEERRAQVERAAALVEGDEASMAMTFEWELAPVLVAQARQTVGEIDEAVARMDAGTYGCCESCGARLPVARLEAIPHARSCVTCHIRTGRWRGEGDTMAKKGPATGAPTLCLLRADPAAEATHQAAARHQGPGRGGTPAGSTME